MAVGSGAVRQLEFYQIVSETNWGVDPGAGHVGFAPDEYSVAVENEVVQLDKHTGEFDDVYVDIVGQTLTGAINSQVWPDNTELLLAMAGLPRVNDDIASYTVHAYDRAAGEYIGHYGLKANTVEITASGGDPKLKMNYDMIGKSEASIALFAKPSLPSSPSFELSDATFTIGNNTEDVVTEFSITINNNLAPSEPKDTARVIKWLDVGRRQIEVTFTVRTHTSLANNYIVLARNRNRETPFVATFDYPGTGSPINTLTFTLDRLVLRSAVRTGGVGDIQTLACTAVARKPAATAAIVATTG